MFQSQKHVFWEALLVTILIFSLGIVGGIMLENWRSGEIESLYRESELRLLDLQTSAQIYLNSELNCSEAISKNQIFADRIFKEAEVLSRYEGAQELTEQLTLEHKKYDILRALLWDNSVKLKKKCKNDFHNVVYIYSYENVDIEKKARQGVFSKVLAELKNKLGSEIVLIPLAGDNNLTSVDEMMGRYNISKPELPVILIDEKIKVTQLKTVDEIESLIK